MENKAIKFNVVSGRLSGEDINQPFWAGTALFFQEENVFQIQLNVFDQPWYLSPNQSRSDSYTIYKRKSPTENGKFMMPIGKAYFADKDKKFITLSVPMWNPKFDVFIDTKVTKH